MYVYKILYNRQRNKIKNSFSFSLTSIFFSHSTHYEYVVMPFDLTNAPSMFQGAMNLIFEKQLRRYVLVFFDDILVYCANESLHLKHLRTFLSIILRENSYYVKKSKCCFLMRRVEYLGHFIYVEGVETDPAKVQIVKEWPKPPNVKQ